MIPENCFLFHTLRDNLKYDKLSFIIFENQPSNMNIFLSIHIFIIYIIYILLLSYILSIFLSNFNRTIY